MADPAVALLTKAYGAVEQCAKRGLHPEEFLTFEFLKEHPIYCNRYAPGGLEPHTGF